MTRKDTFDATIGVLALIGLTIVLATCTATYQPAMAVSQWLEPDSPGAAEYQQRLVRIEQVRQEQCLALNIYHEARGEPEAGKRAVAEVTLTRTKNGNICRAVYAPSQFSWTHQDVRKASGPAWRDAQRVARVMLLAEMASLPPFANGADHFHAKSVKPHWARSMVLVAEIGNHYFYRRA